MFECLPGAANQLLITFTGEMFRANKCPERIFEACVRDSCLDRRAGLQVSTCSGYDFVQHTDTNRPIPNKKMASINVKNIL